MDDNNLHFLIELLDDDNEQSVGLAMAELLKSDEASVDRCLCSLQESDNPRLRRRVHQLESAIRARRRRAGLESGLKRQSLSLLDSCIQLHLAWFDNDLAENVMKQWRELRADLRKTCGAKPSLRDVGRLLYERDYQAPASDDVSADFYCIGVVIDDHYGANILLSVVVLELLRAANSECVIVRSGDDYGVADHSGNVLYPGRDFQYLSHHPFSRTPENCVVLEDCEVIRVIASMLFVCAVGADSFRYIYTLGNALAAIAGLPGGNDFLPYPYNTAAGGIHE